MAYYGDCMAYYFGGDRFYIDENRGVIVCDSKSGETYNINEDAVCTCKGYSIRRDCRHVKEAEQLGLTDKLDAIMERKAMMNASSIVNEKGLFVVCYKAHENRLVVNDEQLITVLDNAKKHGSALKVFKLGEKVIDWNN